MQLARFERRFCSLSCIAFQGRKWMPLFIVVYYLGKPRIVSLREITCCLRISTAIYGWVEERLRKGGRWEQWGILLFCWMQIFNF